jgi:hypothetical protein
MKPYLARLAERAAPARQIAPITRTPAADPFVSAEADGPSAESFTAGSGPHREASIGQETPRVLRAREQPVALSTSSEVSVAPGTELRPALRSQMTQPPAPATAPGAKNRDEEAKPTEKRPTPEALSNHSEHLPEPAEDRLHLIPPPVGPDPVPSTGRATERREDDKRTTFADSEIQNSAKQLPLESELLRLADRFMEELQREIPVPPERDEPPKNEPLPLLPSRQTELHAQQTRAAVADRAPAPSVHIGSLRVEVISPPAAATEPTRSAAPRTTRYGVAHSFGRGIAARQRFGLPQL